MLAPAEMCLVVHGREDTGEGESSQWAELQAMLTLPPLTQSCSYASCPETRGSALLELLHRGRQCL